MAKDPAALLYIDTWLSSTAEMDADCRGWYLNLILHQYDKGSLPNDVELLAQLALVRYSEFERFKQVFEQVLKQKFKVCDDNRLRNDKADEVIRKRQKFTDKRSKSGSVGVVVKLAKSIGFNDVQIERLKEDLYSSEIDIEEAKDKQVLKQVLKLYRNEDEDKDIDSSVNNVKHKLSIWIDENAPTVNKLKEPFTYEQCEKLIEDYDKEYIREILKAMHNYEPLLKKNRSANLTFRNWSTRNNSYETWMQEKGRVKIKMNT